MLDLPSNIADYSTVSYRKRYKIQSGYNYVRGGYSYLRRIPGRKRRIRVDVPRTLIEVPTRYAWAWIIEPRQIAPPKAGWIPLPEYTRHLRKLYEPLTISHDSYFHRKDELRDVVDLMDGFLWYEVPRSRKLRDLGGVEVSTVKIWFIVRHSGTGEYFLWTRARIIRAVPSLEEAYTEAQGIYNEAVGWVKGRMKQVKSLGGDPYLDILDMVAWTVWVVPSGKRQRKSTRIEEVLRRMG